MLRSNCWGLQLYIDPPKKKKITSKNTDEIQEYESWSWTNKIVIKYPKINNIAASRRQPIKRVLFH